MSMSPHKVTITIQLWRFSKEDAFFVRVKHRVQKKSEKDGECTLMGVPYGFLFSSIAET